MIQTIRVQNKAKNKQSYKLLTLLLIILCINISIQTELQCDSAQYLDGESCKDCNKEKCGSEPYCIYYDNYCEACNTSEGYYKYDDRDDKEPPVSFCLSFEECVNDYNGSIFNNMYCFKCGDDCKKRNNDQSCIYLNDSDKYYCYQCQDGEYLTKLEQNSYGECTGTCPNETFQNEEDYECQSCDQTCVTQNSKPTCKEQNNSCHICNTGLYKQSDSEYDKCLSNCENPLTFAVAVDDYFICQTCDKNACYTDGENNTVKCKDTSTNCLQCFNDFYKQNPTSQYSECKSTCEDLSKFQKIVSSIQYECQDCSIRCKFTDTGGLNACKYSNDLCYKCADGYYKQSNDIYAQCEATCPENMYPDQNNICQNCNMVACAQADPATTTCEKENNNCQYCKGLYFKQDIKQSFSYCEIDCPHGYYKDSSEANRNKCIICSSTCDSTIDSSIDVCQGGNDLCYACSQDDGTLYKQDSGYSQCLTTCPNQKYKDSVNQQCVECDEDICNTNISDEEICTSSTFCKQCLSPYYKQDPSIDFSECATICNAYNKYQYTITFENQVCQDCSDTCKDTNPDRMCDINDGTKCKACSQLGQYNLYLQNPSLDYSQCLTTCPQNSFKNTATYQCDLCDTNYCADTDGENLCKMTDRTCLKCKTGFKEIETQGIYGYCLDSCPDNAIELQLQPDDFVCKACDSTCDFTVNGRVCDEIDHTQCSACKQGQYPVLYKMFSQTLYGECVEECPISSYYDGENLKCVLCDTDLCVSQDTERYCTGDSICKQCKSPYFKLNSQLEYSDCVLECPHGYFQETTVDGNICSKCDVTCDTAESIVCTNVSTNCYSCNQNLGNILYLQDDQNPSSCLEDCPDDRYKSGYVCLPCDTEICDPSINGPVCQGSATSCSSCLDPLFKVEINQDFSQCDGECEKNQLAEPISNECVQCHESCGEAPEPYYSCKDEYDECYVCSQDQGDRLYKQSTQSYDKCKNTCSVQKYKDNLDYTCKFCDTNVCVTLTTQMCENTSTKCAQCQQGYYKQYYLLEFSECVLADDCPVGTLPQYSDGEGYVCYPCSETCDLSISTGKVCQDSINYCQKCNQDMAEELFLQDTTDNYSICQNGCSKIKYKNYDTMSCELCNLNACVDTSDDSLNTCIDENNLCRQCKGDFYKQEDSEYSYCLENTCPLQTIKFKQQNNNICKLCHESCDFDVQLDGEQVCSGSIYECYKCDTGYLRKNQLDLYSECVYSCPNDFYEDLNDNVCVQCDINACTQLDEKMCNIDPLQCKQCQGSYYKYDSTQTYSVCVQDCDYDQIKIPQSENNICQTCDDTCDLSVKDSNIQACSVTSSNCYQCSQSTGSDLFKQISTDTYSKCLTTCPLLKYKDSINLTCETCDMTACVNMSDQNIIACKDLPNKCYQCQGNYYKQVSNQQYQYSLCLETCPVNTFKLTQQDNNICEQCDVSCEQNINDGENMDICSISSTLCYKCSQTKGNYYKQIAEDDYSICVTTCPNNRYIDFETLSCKKCDMNICEAVSGQACDGESNYCSKCKDGYYKLDEEADFSECVVECPNEYIPSTYRDVSRICKKCDSTCKFDIDTIDTERVCEASISYCHTCNQNTSQGKLYLSNGQYSTCVTSCPYHQYADLEDHACYDCDMSVCTSIDSSNTCSQDPQKCQKCYGSYTKQSTYTYDFCVQNCPLDKIKVVEDTDSNVCQQCDSKCDNSVMQDGENVCSGSTNLCYKCSQSGNPLYLQTQNTFSQCLETCPDHKYKDSTLMECINCDLNVCYQHVDGKVCQQNKCQQCVTGYYKQNPALIFSECKVDCPNYALQIDEESNGTCQSCSDTCDHTISTDPVCSQQLDKCFACDLDKQLYKLNDVSYSVCVLTCPLTKYKDNVNRVCAECDANACSEADDGISPMCSGSPITCKQCKGNYFKLYNDDTYRTCVETCPTGYIPIQKTNNNYCQKCDETCENDIADGEDVCQLQADYCFKCINGLYKQDSSKLYDNCVDQCDIDNFMNTDTQECGLCNQDACTPIDSKQCIISEYHCAQCKGNYYKQDPSQAYSDCVLNCPTGTIQVPLTYDNKCQTCDSTCDFDVSGDVCSGTTQKCQKCSQQNEVLYLQKPSDSFSQCKVNCPNTSYPDIDSYSCQTCDTTKCTTLSEQMCSKTNSNCKQCKGIYYKTDPNEIYSECVEQCPDNYIKISQDENNYCQICDDTCDHSITSQKVCQTQKNQCYACSQSQGKDLFKQTYSLTNPYQICLEDCPFSKYKDYNDFTCKSCDTSKCVIQTQDYTCETESYICKTCKGIYYKKDKNQIFSECVETCPDGFFQTQDANSNNICEECNQIHCDSSAVPMCSGSSSQCNQCTNGFFKLYPDSQFSICSTNCENGYYKNTLNNECSECDSSCFTCNGGNNDDCLSCDTNYYLNKVTGECLSDCSGVQQTYPDSSTNICENCNSACTSCFGPSQSQCYACVASALSIVNNPDDLPLTYTCYDLECGTGYYMNLNTNSCKPCDGNCQNCQNTETTCTSCPTDKNLYNSKCYDGCPYYTYEKKNGLCEKCNSSCYECEGPNYNDCTSCDTSKSLTLINKQCECPENYYWSENSLVCKMYVGYSVSVTQGSNYNSMPVVKILFEEPLVSLPSLEQIEITMDGLTSSGTITQYSEIEARRNLINYDFESKVTGQDSQNTYYEITVQLLVSITSAELKVNIKFEDLETQSGHPFQSNINAQKTFQFQINQVFLQERNENLSDYFLNIADALDENDFTYIIVKIGIFVFFFNYIVLLAIPVLINTLLPQAFYNLSRIFAVLVFGDCVHWNTGNSEFKDFNTDYDQTEENFKKVGLYANYFINGYLQFFIVFFIWIIFAAFKITYSVKEKNNNKKQQILTVQNSSLYKGYTFFSRLQVRLYDVFLFYFSLYIMLQLQNPTFVGYMNIGGFVFAVLTAVSYMICLFFVFKALNSVQNQSKRAKMDQLYGHLVDDLKLNDIYEQSLHQNFVVRNYRLLNFFKKVGIVVVLVFVYTQPKGQIISIAGILLFSAIYTISVRPFRPLIQNVLKILADIAITSAYVILILAIYKFEKMSENIVLNEDDLDTYSLYSEIMIWLFISYLVLHLIIASLQIFFQIHDLITEYNNEKVSYLNSELQTQYNTNKIPLNSQFNTNVKNSNNNKNNDDDANNDMNTNNDDNNNIDIQNQSVLITDRSQDLMLNYKKNQKKMENLDESQDIDEKVSDDDDFQKKQPQSPKKKKKKQQIINIELQTKKFNVQNEDFSENSNMDESRENSDLRDSQFQSNNNDLINQKKQKKNKGLNIDSKRKQYNDDDDDNDGVEDNNNKNSSPTFKQYNSLMKSQKNYTQMKYKKKIIVVTKYIFNLEMQQSLKNTLQLKSNKNSILYSMEKPNRSYMNSQASFDSVSNIDDDTIFRDKKIFVTGQILYSAKVSENPDEQDLYDIFPTYTQIDPYYLSGNQLKETMKIFDKLKIQDESIFIEKEERLNLTGLNMDPKSREILFSQDLLFVEYFVKIDGKRKKYKGEINF